MTTVRWVRHGQNLANLTRQLSHRVVDHPLTDLGVRQAEELAARLADGPPVIGPVYSSPLRRARQTADIVAGALELEVETVPEFREINAGRYDGRSDDEAWAVYDKVLAAWSAGDRTAGFPAGEDLDGLVQRLRTGLTRIVSAHRTGTGGAEPAGSCLVVAHGASIRSALPLLLAGTPAPTCDIPTGDFAEFELTLGPVDSGSGPGSDRGPDESDVDGARLTGRLVRWPTAG